MKLAWMAVAGDDARVNEAMGRLEVIADAYLSVGTPVQQAAAAMLASRSTAENAIRARTRSNLAWLKGAAVAGSASLGAGRRRGAGTRQLRLPRTRSEEAWVLAFLERDGVYVHPAQFFDFDDEAYAVVSLLTPDAVLQDGVRRDPGTGRRRSLRPWRLLFSRNIGRPGPKGGEKRRNP